MGTRKSAPFISLQINGKYKDFTDFYDENKDKLKPSIVKTLEEMFNIKKYENEYIDRKCREFNILFYNMSNKDLIKY